ncbi:MAG: major capsid protein [Gemmataceae bacterium]
MDKIYLPTNAEIQEIQRDLIPVLEANDTLLSLLKDRYTDKDMVEWEQEDNIHGAMQVRGVDGKPGVVKKGGVNQFSMEPGYYGEYYQFSERELGKARQAGSFGDRIDLTEQVVRKQQMLIERRLRRKRIVISNLLRLGHFTTVSESGNVIHSDSFNLKIRVPGVEWSDKYDATPLKDLREWKRKATATPPAGSIRRRS